MAFFIGFLQLGTGLPGQGYQVQRRKITKWYGRTCAAVASFGRTLQRPSIDRYAYVAGRQIELAIV
jgi:hypothetical protein